MIITIDGPIATGKSTIAKQLAERLGFIHFDTGAMYRCFTYALIKHQIDPANLDMLEQYLHQFNFDIRLIDGQKHYFVENEDITSQIRGPAVTALVSTVAAIKVVRINLVETQRRWAQGTNAVFEGRDLGTVVFPNADLKIFLIGRPEVRAKRRFDEFREKFPLETVNLTLAQALEDIEKRDHEDTVREHSPLRKAEDAVSVDTSDLTPKEIVDSIIALIPRK